MTGEYDRLITDYKPYRRRQVEALVGDEAGMPVEETESELEATEPESAAPVE